jgi:hypothetical protein
MIFIFNQLIKLLLECKYNNNNIKHKWIKNENKINNQNNNKVSSNNKKNHLSKSNNLSSIKILIKTRILIGLYLISQVNLILLRLSISSC